MKRPKKVKYLDPSRIFAQFEPEVQKTLQSQMCFVPNADSRIIAANELLKVLATNQDARILSALSPKLPMYLEAVPMQMKEVLANQVKIRLTLNLLNLFGCSLREKNHQNFAIE